MKFKRLKLSLIAAFLLVSVIPLFGLVYMVKTTGENLIKEKVLSHLLGLSEKSAEAISRFILERGNDIRMLAYMISADDIGSKETLKKHFKTMKEHYRVYLDFFVTDATGRLYFRGGEKEIPAEIIIHRKLDIKLSRTEESASDVFLLDYRGVSVPVILLSTPIVDSHRQRSGTLFALVDFGHMENVLKNTVIKKTGEVYLVNQSGYFISPSRFSVKILKDRIPDSTQRSGGPDKGTYELVDYRGKNVLHAYRRIANFNWYVISEQDKEEALSELFEFRKFMILYAAGTILAAFLLAYFIAILIVNRLKANYRREKELEFQVVQKDKLAALGLLSAGLAHELNTPLANALLYTQMIQEELDENDTALIRKRLATIEEVVKHGSSVVRNLIEFTRHTESGAKETDVVEAFEKLLAIAGPHCESKKIRVEKTFETAMPLVRAETSIVQEILTNLVANAIDAMPQGGTLKLTARYLPPLEKVRIDVTDTGQGIPLDSVGKVFDPFFTTKKQGEGMGLGLFVSYEMARKLGGTIRVISSQEDSSGKSGTVFTLELPVAVTGTNKG
ncbi:MAG: histidine kinase [Proteobacteria bacterium]|nr:histidine kinase [Pseudomonadota bacterium]